jgi:hypothetical protein
VTPSEARLARIGEKELELASAVAAIAARMTAADELTALCREHLAAAARLGAHGGGQPATVAATLRSVALGAVLLRRDHAGALAWLREREHELVTAYMALEADLALDAAARQALRRELLPAAFGRFARVDRLVAGGEPDDAVIA